MVGVRQAHQRIDATDRTPAILHGITALYEKLLNDRNVRNTLRLAISGFLHNPALAPHKGAANGVAFSRDGAWIVSAGDDGEARLLNSQSLAIQASTVHAGPVVAVALSEDGSRVVSAGRDGLLRVWDRSGKVVALGTTEKSRSKVTPDIPALAEHPALKNTDISTWFVLMGPGKLPEAVTAKPKKGLADALQNPELRSKLEASGSAVAQGAVDMNKFLRDETAKYQRVVDFAKIRE